MLAAAARRVPHPGDGLGQRFDNLAHSCRHALPEPLWRALVLVPRPECEEQALWRDVIARATLDALGHTKPLGSYGNGNRVNLAERLTAEARAWFAAERDPWREQIFEMAGYDEVLTLPLVRAEVRRLERERGVATAPPPRDRSKQVPDMPGAEPFAAVRGPRRPFAVERIKRRVSLRDREAARVIFSFLTRSNAHAESAPR